MFFCRIVVNSENCINWGMHLTPAHTYLVIDGVFLDSGQQHAGMTELKSIPTVIPECSYRGSSRFSATS